MAMVPPLTEAGDVIGIVHGAEVPFVFRTCHNLAHGNLEVFELVGECYVHGVMDGRALKEEGGSGLPFHLH